MPWYLGNSNNLDHWSGAGIAVVALWSAVWTGLALWHAATRGQKGWFILFLLVHTAGILEIMYLLFVVKVLSGSQKVVKKHRRS